MILFFKLRVTEKVQEEGLIVCCYFVKVRWAIGCAIWVSTPGRPSESTLLPEAWKSGEGTENTHRENNAKRYPVS